MCIWCHCLKTNSWEGALGLFIACSPLNWCSFNQEGKTACRGMNCLTCLVIICFKEPKLPLSSCHFSTLFCYIIALLSCRQAWTGISQKEKILYEMKQSYNLLHIYSVFTVFSYTHYSIIFTIQLFTLFLKKWIKPKALLNNVIYLENILFHPWLPTKVGSQ